MKLTTDQIIYIVIGLVIVVALGIIIAKRMRLRIKKGELSLDTDHGDKDNVQVKKVDNSKVGVTNRANQNVNVRDISNDSEIKIN